MTEPTRKRPRFQFSIRLAIIAMTLIAGALGAWQYFYVPPVREITVEQAKQIKVGMSQWQVMRKLGSPHRKAENTKTFWTFDYVPTIGNGDSYLEVVFDENGRAVFMRNGRYITYLYSDTAAQAQPDTPKTTKVGEGEVMPSAVN